MVANYMKNKWVDMVVQTALSGIVMLFILWLGFRDADARELSAEIDTKASKEELVTAQIKSKEYVDGRFKNHILIEQQNYNSFKNLMEAYLEGQKDLITSIDKRLERIENKN